MVSCDVGFFQHAIVTQMSGNIVSVIVLGMRTPLVSF